MSDERPWFTVYHEGLGWYQEPTSPVTWWFACPYRDVPGPVVSVDSWPVGGYITDVPDAFRRDARPPVVSDQKLSLSVCTLQAIPTLENRHDRPHARHRVR